MQKIQYQTVTETETLFQNDLFEDFETMAVAIHAMENIIEEELNDEIDLMMTKPEQAEMRDEFAIQMAMMADLLETDNSTEMIAKADEEFTHINSIYINNQKAILASFRNFEKVMRATNLFFQNAQGLVDDNVTFMVVNPEMFAGKPNPAHYNEFYQFLTSQYYKRRLVKSPLYFGYIGDIEDGAQSLAKTAQETLALAVVDVAECKNEKIVLKKVANRALGGQESEWGNLVVNATWLIGRKAYPNLETEGLGIPATAAIIGKFLSTMEGRSASGFQKGALTDALDVKFSTDTRDDVKFAEKGMLLIDKEDGVVRIFGDRTAIADNSENDVLRKVSKMRAYNTIMKDLVDFCNLNAGGDWGRQEKRDFKETIAKYLNKQIALRKIQGFRDLKVVDTGNDSVEILVEIDFFTTKSTFNIKISGKKDEEFSLEESSLK